MNLSLIHLSIIKSTDLSYLFTRNIYKINTNFNLYSSNFNQIFKGFYFLNYFSKVLIKESKFTYILNSVLNFESYQKEEKKTISNQQIYTDTQVFIQNCIFLNCISEKGAAVCGTMINFTVSDSKFLNNYAKVGGCILLNKTIFVSYERILFFNNSAEYSATSHTDSQHEANTSYLNLVNISNNFASKWTGGLRIDRAGGIMKNSIFSNNKALVCGGFFDFSWKTSHRTVLYCSFFNNSAKSRGGAYTCSHIMQKTNFTQCLFYHNFCELNAHSISLETIDQIINIFECYFDGIKEKQVSMRYGKSILNIENCIFEMNFNEIKEKEKILLQEIILNPPRIDI